MLQILLYIDTYVRTRPADRRSEDSGQDKHNKNRHIYKVQEIIYAAQLDKATDAVVASRKEDFPCFEPGVLALVGSARDTNDVEAREVPVGPVNQ